MDITPILSATGSAYLSPLPPFALATNHSAGEYFKVTLGANLNPLPLYQSALTPTIDVNMSPAWKVYSP